MKPFNQTPEVLQARYSAIVESCDDAIVSKDLNGTVQSWNPAAERMFGYTAAEMIGRPIALLFPPDRPDEEKSILERIRRGEKVDHYITERVRKDGRHITVSITISPIKNEAGHIIGASKIGRDLTEQLGLQALLYNIVSSSDDAIVGKDLNGVVQSWNKGAEAIFGYTASEMIGQPITKIIPPDRLDEEPRILEQIRRGDRVDHFETVRVRKDGQRIDVSVTISPIKDPLGRVLGISKIARDITLIKRAEMEKSELLKSEQAARQEAERVSRLKDEFLATLSHELRTPLQAILGWSQLLRMTETTPADLQQGLQSIEQNAKAQNQLICDLLDMTRIISGKMQLEVEKFNLASVVESAIATVKPAADAKSICISTNFDRNSGEISGDPTRLQQVAWNLLSNAIKFTPRGGLIQVKVARVNSHVEMRVTDSGVGIKAEFLPLIFQRFTQADASITRVHGGLGIGLAIVRQLVELHGGAVKAKSAGEGKGATFVVSLPIRAVKNELEPEGLPGSAHKRVSPSILHNLSGLKVLVVDDEPDARELIRRVLEASEADVRTASSAAEGIELLKEYLPDLLLTDIGMPEEDGYAFIRKIRKLSGTAGGQTLAIALTAFARPEDRRRALVAGFQTHLGKPVEPAELLAVVAGLTSRYNPQVD